jgi:hypothetical protein
MFSAGNEQILKFERDLERFKSKALPFATRKTINDAGFAQKSIIQADLGDKFILRNSFTRKSIRVDRARTLQINRQATITGSVASYMDGQEFGGLKRKSGKHGVAIPTSYSAGQAMSAKPRTRRVSKGNKLTNVKIPSRRVRATSKRQSNIIKIKEAKKRGDKFVYLELMRGGRRRGLFRVLGSKRRPKIRMIYDLTNESVDIPKNPSFQPAFKEVKHMLPAFYADAMRFQLRRHKILGY